MNMINAKNNEEINHDTSMTHIPICSVSIHPTHAVVHVELEFPLRDRLLDALAVAGVARPPPAPPPVVHQAARLLAVPVVGAAAKGQTGRLKKRKAVRTRLQDNGYTNL